MSRGNRKALLVAALALAAAAAMVLSLRPARAWELLPGEKPPTGPEIVADLRCHACHLMPGADQFTLAGPGGVRVIPVLDFEADRARPEWIFEFMKEPFRLRPELRAQMPYFDLTDAEILDIIEFLMTLKLKQKIYVPKSMPSVLGPYSPELLKQAKDIFDLYKCFQCHLLEGKVIDPEKGQSGPDFIYTYNRLQVDWNYQWLVDPQAYIPGTKMPNFFYLDGDELIDDPDRDMHLILVYMYSLGERKDYRDITGLRKNYQADAARGKKLAEDLYCTGCHEFEGWDKLDVAANNPKHEGLLDLTHLASRRDRAFLIKHLGNPQPARAEAKTGARAGFQLNKQELKALVDYLLTFK